MTAAPPNPLAELEPVVARLLERHLATAKEWFPHDYVPWDLGRSFTAAPWEAADSGLSAVARTALERERMDHVSRGYYPRRIPGPLDGLVYVTLQELATRIAHRNTGAITGDPVAERLLVRVALDENLHYAFYRDVACAAIELDPSAMVLAMKRQVLGFAMPGFELRGFRERAITIAAAGIYDLRIHHDQVLCPVLLRQWRLRELRGLNDEAERAREAVLTFLESLAGASASGDEHQAAAPANACA